MRYGGSQCQKEASQGKFDIVWLGSGNQFTQIMKDVLLIPVAKLTVKKSIILSQINSIDAATLKKLEAKSGDKAMAHFCTSQLLHDDDKISITRCSMYAICKKYQSGTGSKWERVVALNIKYREDPEGES